MKHPFRYLLATLLMASSVFNSHANDTDDDDGPHPTLLPLDLPAIQSVVVTTASIDVRSEEEKKRPAFDCNKFQVKQSDIETFFKLTKKISRQDYMHAIDWMHCQALGDIHFADGTSARWRVMVSGAGFVAFADGRRTHLLCDQCTEPFLP